MVCGQETSCLVQEGVYVHMPACFHLNPGWQAGWKGVDQRICKKISAERPLIFEANCLYGDHVVRNDLGDQVARSPGIAATSQFKATES